MPSPRRGVGGQGRSRRPGPSCSSFARNALSPTRAQKRQPGASRVPWRGDKTMPAMRCHRGLVAGKLAAARLVQPLARPSWPWARPGALDLSAAGWATSEGAPGGKPAAGWPGRKAWADRQAPGGQPDPEHAGAPDNYCVALPAEPGGGPASGAARRGKSKAGRPRGGGKAPSPTCQPPAPCALCIQPAPLLLSAAETGGRALRAWPEVKANGGAGQWRRR